MPRFRFYTIFVFIGLAIFVPILDFVRYGLKGDFWWVWNSGRWMAVHHQILEKNPTAWNGAGLAGKSWTNLEWAWQWFIYAVNPHLHPLIFIGVLFVFEVLMLLAFGWTIRAMAPKLTAEATWALYAVYALLLFPFTIRLRAELFSYAAFPFLLGVLWRARTQPRWLIALAPLTLIWANVHGSWLMIVVLSGLEIAFSLWYKSWRLAFLQGFWGIAVPLGVVIAFTPFHVGTLTYAWWLDHNPYINGFIQEWQSINFHQPTFLLIGVAVMGAWLWRAHARLSYPLILDLWFIGITLAFFDQIRMIPYFGMVFALWFAFGLAQSRRYTSWLSGERGVTALRWAGAAGLVAGLGAALVMASAMKSTWVRPVVPVKLVAFMKEQPHRVVLAPIDDGGYLEAKGVTGVYADGRSDFFLAHGQRFQDYVALVLNATVSPRRVSTIFSTHHIDMVVWPKSQLLATLGWYMDTHHWQKVDTQGSWAVWIAH